MRGRGAHPHLHLNLGNGVTYPGGAGFGPTSPVFMDELHHVVDGGARMIENVCIAVLPQIPLCDDNDEGETSTVGVRSVGTRVRTPVGEGSRGLSGELWTATMKGLRAKPAMKAGPLQLSTGGPGGRL